MALAAGCSLAGQIRDARRIDASPVRISGVVDSVVQVKGGADVRVSYRVDGRRFATEDLPVGQTTHPTPGAAVCLEAAATAPQTVRLCGQKYPNGDDVIPAKGLLAVAGIAGTSMATGWFVVLGRQRKHAERRTEHRCSNGCAHDGDP
ncbi:hypothetical protein ACF07W_10445 [Streptomyces sp. NPDC015140]|uniref:hypothetical protein n=1 Tax=Streptomyces sp. NPDC015140 TaxID=3364943 RepID=UPI003702DF46